MTQTFKLNGISKQSDLLRLCDIDKEIFKKALTELYNCYYKKTKTGKNRLVEQPNDYLKEILRRINNVFQELKCSDYCYCGWKGLNNIKNAEAHAKNQNIITLDISAFFPNTKAEYVENFFAEKLGISGEALSTLVNLTTFNGHLPTGAPTSTILSCLVHQDIFDDIKAKMAENSIKMTVYVDDITLSSHKHIGNWAITYCKNAVKKHGLWIKTSKIKRFGYKNAWITGVRLNQAGQKCVPYALDFAVIKILKEKAIEEMTERDVQKLLGKIGYIQQISPDKFETTKRKLIKRLKEVMNTTQNA